ncbi:septal ring lytic transglycosylase RlpA family protein (plasmid) [Sinorhizobium chiapasense]|uniref:septal ring lytic transglycosylase RlpA family protein n=1 Tax=Sinorhizobium chiapasense TaxID=501572 RepID=UPI002FE106C9
MVIDVGKAVKGARCLAIVMVCACCATCTVTQAPDGYHIKGYSEKIDSVEVSPRATRSKHLRKGGGRYTIGKPYRMKGTRYFPKEDPTYDKNGVASWYGSAFRGRLTANGEVYNPGHLSAAHPTLPLPSYVRVTNLDNGSSLILRVNDRGPFHQGRIIDVSRRAAEMLDLKHRGTAPVRVQYMGRARLDGHDAPYLMASYVRKRDHFPDIHRNLPNGTGVMVASMKSAGDHLQRYSRSLWSAKTDLVGNRLSPSYGAGIDVVSAFQTSAQFVMFVEIGHVSFERPASGAARVRDVVTFDVKYCLDKEESSHAVRDKCGVLPLPAGNRNERLVGVISRKHPLSGYRWRGKPSCSRSAARLSRRTKGRGACGRVRRMRPAQRRVRADPYKARRQKTLRIVAKTRRNF